MLWCFGALVIVEKRGKNKEERQKREHKRSIKLKIMLERIIRAIAGTFIIVSVLLAMYVNINWLWFTLFVGANLFQSAITKWCLMEDILKRFGVKTGNESREAGSETVIVE